MSKLFDRKYFGRVIHSKNKKPFIMLAGLLIIGIICIFVWQYSATHHDDNVISGNGRIEATEINVSPRISGRIKEILVHDGDDVKAGQVLVEMDTDVLTAQLREANGTLLQVQNSVVINASRLIQRESEKIAVEAILKQRAAELEVAERKWTRSLKLVSQGATSQQTADDDWAGYQSALAAKEAAQAQISVSNAAIITAQAEVKGAESAIESSQGAVERIEADINDSALKAPRDGRVQYLIAQSGEVVSAGSPVLSLVDLTDVYMIFFLPTAYAGRVAIKEEMRLILDAAPQYVIPAYVSYVSDVAQFTPKSVETNSEREKLMFRVKAQIPKEILEKYITHVKTGLPGVAYIRIDPDKPWPDYLKVNL